MSNQTNPKRIAYVKLNPDLRDKNNQSKFYYQQRFNSGEANHSHSVLNHLVHIWEKHQCGSWTPNQALKLLRLEELATKPIITLSTGENRRLLIAAALVQNPDLIRMDEPLTGLDTINRSSFEALIKQIKSSGIAVELLGSNPATLTSSASQSDAASNNKRLLFDDRKAQLLKELLIASKEKHDPTADQKNGKLAIIKMSRVKVQIGSTVILNDINWEVLPGEAWLIEGHNGAGKSTLLSLINADHPQAYQNELYLFGRKRGTGESIWDIKKEIGYISPELHQFFSKQQTALNTIISGFYDTMGLFKKSNDTDRQLALDWLDLVEMREFANKVFRELSPDQQRLILCIRALVKNPKLLILDEPFQHLKTDQRNFLKNMLNLIHSLRRNTLIFVSHHREDVPSCVSKLLKLENGSQILTCDLQ